MGILKYLGGLLILALTLVPVYFLSKADYSFYPEGYGMVKVAFKHSGRRVQECGERQFYVDEGARFREQQKVGQGIRMDTGRLEEYGCSRERHPVRVRLNVDSEEIFSKTVPPAGLKRDGSSYIYHRRLLPEGLHTFTFEMHDGPPDTPPYRLEGPVEIRSGEVALLRFDEKADNLILD